MRVAVAYKWAANPTDATVNADGTVDWSRAKPGISEYDTCAIELARHTSSAHDAELVGFSVGPPAIAVPMARKAPLSRGIDRLMIVADASLENAESVTVGKILAAVSARNEVNLVVTGDSSVDRGSRVVPGVIAHALNWPLLTGVTAIRREDDVWIVTRHADGGTQSVRVAGPLVASAAGDAITAPVPSMKDIMAAGKKPVEEVPLRGLGVPGLTTTFSVINTAKPDVIARKSEIFEGADPEEVASSLIAALRNSNSL